MAGPSAVVGAAFLLTCSLLPHQWTVSWRCHTYTKISLSGQHRNELALRQEALFVLRETTHYVRPRTAVIRRTFKPLLFHLSANLPITAGHSAPRHRQPPVLTPVPLLVLWLERQRCHELSDVALDSKLVKQLAQDNGERLWLAHMFPVRHKAVGWGQFRLSHRHCDDTYRALLAPPCCRHKW